MGEVRDLEERAARPFWKRRESYFRFGILLVVVAGVVALALLRDKFTVSGQVGYPVIAFLSFIASASVFVPIPGVLSVCGGGLVLSPLVVALVAGASESLGELTGYAAGFGGRGFVERARLYQRMVGWMEMRGWLVLFVLSVIPNPVFDVAGVAAGALRYPIWKFLGVVCVGKFIKSLGIAYACFFGVESVLRLFNFS